MDSTYDMCPNITNDMCDMCEVSRYDRPATIRAGLMVFYGCMHNKKLFNKQQHWPGAVVVVGGGGAPGSESLPRHTNLHSSTFYKLFCSL